MRGAGLKQNITGEINFKSENIGKRVSHIDNLTGVNLPEYVGFFGTLISFALVIFGIVLLFRSPERYIFTGVILIMVGSLAILVCLGIARIIEQNTFIIKRHISGITHRR